MRNCTAPLLGTIQTVFMILFFFLFLLKDEKNQVLTTNIWLQMVSWDNSSPCHGCPHSYFRGACAWIPEKGQVPWEKPGRSSPPLHSESPSFGCVALHSRGSVHACTEGNQGGPGKFRKHFMSDTSLEAGLHLDSHRRTITGPRAQERLPRPPCPPDRCPWTHSIAWARGVHTSCSGDPCNTFSNAVFFHAWIFSLTYEILT